MSSPPINTNLLNSWLFQGELLAAVETMASASAEDRGAVFTRRFVVDFMLDLVGYTNEKPLHQMSILEPSFGNGDFLFPIVERLLTSFKSTYSNFDVAYPILSKCVRAVELNDTTYLNTSRQLFDLLSSYGMSIKDATNLVETWLIQGDFLLSALPQSFDFVVGNPPYVRQEKIPAVLLAAYREQYYTIYDRADLYIPFIERSLRLLAQNGHFAFICSDRWTKNRYGGPLRNMVSKHYNLKIYIDMVGKEAFHSEVSAYPSIAVIARESAGITRVAQQPLLNETTLQDLGEALISAEIPVASGVRELTSVMNGAEPWIFDASDHLDIVRRLEKNFPSLEEAGCKVGIGVATGADNVFIKPYDELDVEPDRKLRLITTQDIVSGEVDWHGLGLVNPFDSDGKLVNLDSYPRLRQYLAENRERVLNRHCARKSPANWYRTIDKIHHELTLKPKLLIPDIKGEANIVHDAGGYYPHHNLYFITSESWDLAALQTILKSGIARLFVSAYSTKMRGGYLRFQAQYLRRIRIPHWHEVPADVKQMLIRNATEADNEACNMAVSKLYGLSPTDQKVLYFNSIKN